MNIQTLIEQRASSNHFDRHRSLSPTQIELLASLAGRSPSAFHLQNWQFIAVQTAEAKARWFQSLPLATRMEMLCSFMELILAVNPKIVEPRDAQLARGRVRIISMPRSCLLPWARCG